jgi:hypothetical protein
MSNLNSSSDSSSVNLTTNQPDQQFAVGYDGSRRLGGESPAPFIGVPKIVVYRARSATVKRSAGGDDLVWWVEFEAENSTIERAFFKHSDTALYNQLGSVLGYDPSNLKFDTYTKFSVRPEVQVSRKGPMWTLHAICVPSRDEMITLLKEYAEQSGAMEHKGYAINPIIHDYIIKAEKPDFDAAKKAIEGLTTTAEKGLHAGKRIAEQAATALEATHDPLYATPLTPEMVKHYQGDDDPLVDDLKADGASEVEIEDTPPLLGSGGISEDKPLSVSGEQPRDIKHSTTDPIKMCFAIPNYIKRELGIDDSAASKHLTALFHGPIESDKIRENGTAATWRQVEQYVDRFRTQEQEEVAKPKPTAESESKEAEPEITRPTTAEIDAAKVRIRDMGITTVGDFKAATGFENIPAALEAGKTLKEIETAAWNWDKPENATEKPPSATEQPKGSETPAKVNRPVPANNSHSTNGNPFQKASKKNSKLRMVIGGVPGGGKTYTALQTARALYPDGKIALIDTERGSAEKYADLFDFDVLSLDGNYSPERYIDMIHAAESHGYDLLIIDSLSHEWDGDGGVLDLVDDLKRKQSNAKDGYSAWREMTPRHNALIAAILEAKLHVIVTMRCKWKNVIEKVETQTREGTKIEKVNKKVIGALVQREKIEYEFDLVALVDESQNLKIDKSRCPALTDYKGRRCGAEMASKIAAWLNIGTTELAPAA